jgi:hypothetical protein
MAKRRVKTRLKRSEVKKLIRDLPGMLSGRINSRFALHKIFWGAVAHSLFTSIHQAFQDKSYHEPDDLGNSWRDLTRHTKAYKRDVSQGGTSRSLISIRRRNMRKDRHGERLGLGILTAAQYRAWKTIFGRLAAQVAWARLKDMGAKTMWDVLGSRHLRINIRTGALLNSVRPGKFDPSSGYKKGDKNQVYKLHRGSITLGSGLARANHVGNHHRPIWPEEIDGWIDKAVEFGRDAVYERLSQILESS